MTVESIETRWMRSADMQEVLRIMDDTDEGGDERGLNSLLRKSSVMCVVAEIDGSIVGFAIYDVARVSKLKLLSLAVEQNAQRKGVGRRLAELVLSKLNKKRNKVEAVVSEYNLPAQLFLRSMGFRAVSMSPAGSGSCDYKFTYKLPEMVGDEA